MPDTPQLTGLIGAGGPPDARLMQLLGLLRGGQGAAPMPPGQAQPAGPYQAQPQQMAQNVPDLSQLTPQQRAQMFQGIGVNPLAAPPGPNATPYYPPVYTGGIRG